MPTAPPVRLFFATFAILFGLLAPPLKAQGTQPPAPAPSSSQPATSSSATAEAPAPDGAASPPLPPPVKLRLPDFNRDIYYKNKLELSLESGWLPINVPLVYNFLVGSPYTTNPLPYTLVPYILSLRWQTGDIKGPIILRGNWDFTFSGSYTDITRGPETRYFAFDYGIRRNFVPRRWLVAPYFEMRGGIGNINAKGYKVTFGQGKDLTFTYMMGSGVRYNFNPRYSISLGLNYFHVSDAYLSEPKLEDYGINVYGPMAGINIRLGKPKSHPAP